MIQVMGFRFWDLEFRGHLGFRCYGLWFRFGGSGLWFRFERWGIGFGWGGWGWGVRVCVCLHVFACVCIGVHSHIPQDRSGRLRVWGLV